MNYKILLKARIITFIITIFICAFLTIVGEEVRYILLGLFLITLGVGLLAIMVFGYYRGTVKANSLVEVFISIVTIQLSLGFIFAGLALFFPASELLSLTNYALFIIVPQILFSAVFVAIVKKIKIRVFYKYYEITGMRKLLFKIYYFTIVCIISYLIVVNQ